MLGLFSTTANASMRPPITAGPISRNSRFFNLSAGFGWSAAATAAGPPVTARRKVRNNPSPHERRNMIVLLCAQGRESYRSRGRAASFVSGRAVGSLRSNRRARRTRRCAVRAGQRSARPTHPASCMLGLRIVFTDCMFPENWIAESPLCSPLRALLLGACLVLLLTAPLFGESAERQQARLPSGKGGIVNLSAVTQSRRGDLFIADGDVDITYEGARLRADHLEFNEKTKEAVASGHVQFDYANQHLDGDQAAYNVRTGHGVFEKVRGSVKIERRPNSSLLVTDNPLYFEAKEVERVDESLYIVRGAWVTVCDPERPKWKFYAPRARIRLEKNVALVNANFRMFRVPLIWLPYATAPAGRKVRQSGFLIPDIGNSSRKGFILGDAFYWAPFEWMDTTLSGQLLSRRGSAERGEFRARPWENTSIHYDYFGVIDRGLKDSNGVRNPQGGHGRALWVCAARHRAAPRGAVAQFDDDGGVSRHAVRCFARCDGRGQSASHHPQHWRIRAGLPPAVARENFRAAQIKQKMETHRRAGRHLPVRDRRERFRALHPLRFRRHAHGYKRGRIRDHTETLSQGRR